MAFVRNNLPDYPALPKYRISGQIVGALQLEACEGEICTFVNRSFPPAKGDSFLFKPFVPRPGDWYVMFEDGEKRFVRSGIFDLHYIRSEQHDPENALQNNNARVAQTYRQPT